MNETKVIIGDAFLDLASKKKPDKITIMDICTQAHISRETFYYHFKDKYDLFEWLYKYILSQRIKNYSTESSWPEMIEKVINDAAKYDSFFEQVLKKGTIEYSEIIFEALYDFYCAELSSKRSDGKLSPQEEAEIYIYLKGGIAFLKHHFNLHPNGSIQNAAKLIAGAMPHALTDLWQKK